jgi:opacity protein-like surface antigen
MKKIVVVVAALSLLAAVTQAQDVVPNVSGGSKALLFSFNGLAYLGAGDFEGGLGAKYFLSSDLAVRAGLSFGTASQTIPTNPTPPSTGTDGSRSATMFGVAAGVEFHPGKGRVSPYFGAAAQFSTTSTEYKSAEVGNPPNPQTSVKNRTTGETINGTTYNGRTDISVYGIAGVEFFLYKELSIAAEYRLGFTTGGLKDQEVDVPGYPTVTSKSGSTTAVGIESAGTLTLAVYF